MRVVIVRIGVLAAFLALGWITIANAQRGDDQAARPVLTGPTGDLNPLRESDAAAAIKPYPSSAKPGAEPGTVRNFVSDNPQPAKSTAKGTVPFSLTRKLGQSLEPAAVARQPATVRPKADPFGLQARGLPAAVPVSAEQPVSGPALGPSDSMPAAENRYSDRPERTARRDADRYSAPAAVADREPARFKADPFALPANPTRPTREARNDTDRGYRAATAATSLAAELESDGAGLPGSEQLEGVQSPQLTIQKSAPSEVQVGKPASFRVTVRNVGQTPAAAVEIRDVVPRGARLIETTPPATRVDRGEIVWTLGTIRPGEEASVAMELMPTAEGEIGSVATVQFGAEASARTVATRPQLVVETTGPGKVLIGEQAVLSITISNPGSGAATGVIVEERIPPGLKHPAGAELEYQVGDLKPGESRKLDLPLVASQPGPTTNVLVARADGNLRAEESRLNIEVLAPQLDVLVEGPKRRYLERQATYQVWVANPGTAPAKQIELIANLPPGLQFVSANNAGYYEEATRTVRWRLEELPAIEKGSVELVTLTVEAGRQAIRLRFTAQKDLSVETEQPVVIEGLAAILFQAADTVDPLGIGDETIYEVHVVNQGSKAATNVRLTIDLPAELKPLAAQGPTTQHVEGNRVQFNGLAQLAPKAETTYRLRVKALRSGDLRTRFLLETDDLQSPIVKEESTQVFADE